MEFDEHGAVVEGPIQLGDDFVFTGDTDGILLTWHPTTVKVVERMHIPGRGKLTALAR